MTARTRTLGRRTFPNLVEAISPTEQQETQEAPETQQRDPVRLLLLATLFLAIVGGFLLVRWRMNQTASMPDSYLAYTEKEDAYKDNAAVKEARRLRRESNRGCPDFVIVERSYGWYVYCEGDAPTWLTEHAE